MRFIIPILIFTASIGIFFGYTIKEYDATKELRTEKQTLNSALANARELRSVRDHLLETYNSFLPSDIERLKKILPNNVDNIKLIIEIESLASQHNLLLNNVDFGQPDKKIEDTKTNVFISSSNNSGLIQEEEKYGSIDLGFVFQGDYDDFISFLDDIDHSLRLITIKNISFSSDVLLETKNKSLNNNFIYQYTLKIKSYWLK